jgi:DNA-binding NarL/FixJ family response regulator
MRVIIGEDSALFREGLAALLVLAGHDVVATAADAVTLLSERDDIARMSRWWISDAARWR